MPELPLISQDDDLAALAVANSLTVKQAEEKAKAQEVRAKGEHRELWPTADYLATSTRTGSLYNLRSLLRALRGQ